ncbi:methylated-DNA--[protein]-cysteine S-methyltransferase [Agromyces mediolanus]|uniref:methylated-DNA--[protein]-cysteine S-methyltransferase n=1 Tax=Agromyces mediolanus TaxID=41986 RepID=UPI003839A04D
MSNVFLLRIESPIGRIELVGDDDHLVALTIEDADGLLPHDGEPERPNPILEQARDQLAEYFAGTRTDFDVPVQPAGGSEFQRAVWSELSRLHWGEATSYGALAAAIGKPGSGRAIGGAVGANPIPIIIGCHRVLASDGRVTGYSGGKGVSTKLWLLGHEQIGFAA